MSRSRRKTPCRGITTAVSDAEDKRLLNRRVRHRNKIRVHAGDEPFERKQLYDLMDKDGKGRFDPVVHPKLMRK